MHILVPIKTMSQDCRKGAGGLWKKLIGKSINGSCDCKYTRESVHLSLEELAAQVRGTENIGRQQLPFRSVCKSHQICRHHTKPNSSATCGGPYLHCSVLVSAAAGESAASLCSVARSVSVQGRDRCARRGGEAPGLGWVCFLRDNSFLKNSDLPT